MSSQLPKQDLRSADHMEKGAKDCGSSTIEPTVTLSEGTAHISNLGSTPSKKQFGIISIIAFAFVICNSWAGVAGSVQIALLQGGPVTLIYSIIVSSVGFICIALTMAELASVYPTAGGQYHFVSILAPPRIRRGMSYACGLLSILSWIAIGASVSIIIAQQIMAVVELTNDGFVTKTWQIFLVYQAVAIWALVFNLFFLKRNPWTHEVGFTITISLFIACFIAFLVRGKPRAPNAFVWTTFINYTGWPDGVCFITGLSTSCFMYGGLDSSMHMAEECTNAARTVPKAIISAVIIGFCTAFSYSIVMLYSLTDIDAILTSTNFISVVVQVQGFHSTSIATGMTIAGVVLGIFVLHAIQETTSRMTWSFARDQGLICSRYMEQIHPTLQVPVWSLLVSWAILVICGCIYLASTTAFNALIGSSVVLQMLTFIMPAALLIYRKRSPQFLPPNRPFAVPSPLGWLANIIVVCFALVTIIFFNFPPFLPVTASTMNYTPVIIGICVVFGVVNWLLHAGKQYRGPIIKFSE